MSIYYTNDKTPVQIELKPLASGGEGEVFRVVTAVANLSNQCAKIYFPNQRTKEREEKIKFMVQNTPIQQQNSRFLLCLPTKMLFDKRGKFVGFLMPTAFNGSIQLYELVTTQISKKISNEWHQKYDRTTKQGIENRLKLCTNISIAVHQIHQTRDLVLVDFKPQNILITNDAKVSVIDLDSIQISNGRNVIYPAKVATPEYTPKEAERLNPSVDYIPETWDRFSLAVVFYEILFGIHPYTSTAGGQYSDISTISEKISKNLFVHGSKKSYLTTIPPIHKNYELLPNGLKLLFLLAFENGNQSPTKRPTAESWGQEITEELKSINIRPNLITAVQKPIIIKETKTIVKTNIPQKVITPISSNQNSSSNFGILIIVLLPLFCFFMIVMSNKNSKIQETDVDSTVAVVDSVATAVVNDQLQTNNLEPIIADTVAIPDTEIKNEESQGTNFSAEEISKIFLNSLNISDCETAWNVTNNPIWENKGKQWFCSSSAYGGVHRVDIKQLYEVANYGNEVIIFAEYYAEDSFNGNANYSQNLRLNKIYGRWYIVEIRNVK